MPPFRYTGLLAVPLLLAACSPTFNWRALPVDSAPLQALMPCKPDKAEREVPLAGVPTTLQMRSCDTGGLTFAVAWADVGEPARAAPALAGWRRATLLALHASPALADEAAAQAPARVVGASEAIGLQAEGRDPRGEPVRVRAVHAARGTLLVQAAIYGRAIDERVADTFFEGLQLK
ncbi:MAG: hypothetical protein IBJ14_16040 [Hydrogenophaga sp.]|nr:hypothetical protein [Hydrogenophaga sp.]